RPSSGEFARHPVALHTSPEADEVPAPRQTLLIWDDNPVLRELVRAQLSALRCDISWYETPSALISRASEGGWDALMLLSDRALDGSVTAQWLLNAAADDPRPLLVL